ncbi:hypothetical protein, partial [Variovorax sp. KBW07]|uniref:hypothetical protein n=1 Tax=Variovorax sp. KBW07 TaxID=2153358 RepID=UPI001C895839
YPVSFARALNDPAPAPAPNNCARISCAPHGALKSSASNDRHSTGETLIALFFTSVKINSWL